MKRSQQELLKILFILSLGVKDSYCLDDIHKLWRPQISPLSILRFWQRLQC